MLITLVALYSPLKPLAPVRSIYTSSSVADTHSSAGIAKAAMGGFYKFDMSTIHHPNGKYIPRMSVSLYSSLNDPFARNRY